MSEPRSPALDAGPYEIDPGRLRPWKDVEREALSCTRCRLHESRTKVVFGGGPVEAELLVLGVAPGRHEDVQGAPFLGASGNVLNNALADAGLSRDDCYVTNLVKCHPPGARAPQADELDACAGHLFEQIARVRPRVIVTLGELPATLLLRRRMPLDKVAGYRLAVFDGVTLIPTYDPALAVRGNTLAMTAIRRDIATAKAVLDGRVPPAEPARARGSS